MFSSSRQECPQWKLHVVHLVQPESHMEPAPVPTPGAACPVTAVSMPGHAQWPDPTLTRPHIPCHSTPGLPLADAPSPQS
ncbi:hypothetical protein AAY473_003287 [Plecturocebus cupreus]